MTVPRRAVLAMLEPLRVENRLPPATDSKLNLPGMRPIHFSTVSILRTATPEWNIISPIKINMGTGSRRKVVRELKIWRTI
jgi:hypothetical protein